jgi:hypothetical protein
MENKLCCRLKETFITFLYMLECCCFFNIRHVLYILELLNMLELMILNFCTCYMSSKFTSDACCYFFKIVTGGSLQPRAASLLLPRAKRWKAISATAPFLLPCARRLRQMTLLWRCGRWLLFLQHAWRRLQPMTPPQPPRATMMNAPMSKRWAHMNCF